MATATKRITHYVSLDLGSDSMAAFVEELASPPGRLVPLQEPYKTFPDHKSFDLLLDGTDPSRRLQTRIYLDDPLDSKTLPPNHADASFINKLGAYVGDDDDASIFHFFSAIDAGRPAMPNPKLIFQTGCQKAVPFLSVKDSADKVQFDPAVLLQDVTVQVINNFVLKSSALRSVPIDAIHLVLTIPNVYSTTHSRQIESFVKQHVQVGAVSVVYESDALAYYMLEPNAAPHTRQFCDTVVQPQKRDHALILTLDIGRGTTDLSLLRIQAKRPGQQQEQHSVLARTGVCSGGQALTYVLAQYFNERLLTTYAAAQAKPLYDFTSHSEQHRHLQSRTNRYLERYIEAIKRSIQADYTLSLDDKDEKDLIDELFKFLPEAESGKPDIDELRRLARPHFQLPRDLKDPAGTGKRWWRRALNYIGRRQRRSNPAVGHIEKLVREIEQYVRENVNDMLEDLKTMAAEREKQQLPGRKTRRISVLPPNDTFVIVAGQAAQFKPIRAAIERWVKGKLARNKVHFVADEAAADEAKVACCKGAVALLKKQPLLVNSDEFFGTYGFWSAIPPLKGPPFLRVNTVELVNNSKTTVSEFTKGLYYFVYVSRAVETNNHQNARKPYSPEPLDGYTSVLTWIDQAPPNVEVEFDRATQLLTVGGQTMYAINTHGYVNAEIQKKVWPIIVKTAT